MSIPAVMNGQFRKRMPDHAPVGIVPEVVRPGDPKMRVTAVVE